MSISPSPQDPSEKTIRVRPKRRTRPRRIGPLWLPFWWLARPTRRIRPILWGVAYGTAGSALLVMVGARLLSVIGDVAIPALVSPVAQAVLVAGVVAILVLRLIGIAEAPEDWKPADVRWIDPRWGVGNWK